MDDESVAREAIRLALRGVFKVHAFPSPEEAALFLEGYRVPIALLDLNIGDACGVETLRSWRARFPEVEVVFCSGETDITRAIECMRHGAADYLVKPASREHLMVILNRVLERSKLKASVERLSPLVQPKPIECVGTSLALQEVRRKIGLLKGQNHLNVLILGESGTGKEIAARLLHQQEEDPARPFVVANMPAIPAALMESELFGVEKGAYTDARSSRAGKFEIADGGDILLDEIGDLAFETQAKLLRTLQEKQVERVGSNRPRKIEFRVISATNQPLAELISDGKFREDLMYRLSDMVLWMPPLRERREDIPLLAQHFIRKYWPREHAPTLSEGALEILVSHPWPGNIRQLESTIKRSLVFTRGNEIQEIEIFDPQLLQPRPPTDPRRYEEKLAKFERDLIEAALKRHDGDRNACMTELGLSRATFYRKLQQLRLTP